MIDRLKTKRRGAKMMITIEVKNALELIELITALENRIDEVKKLDADGMTHKAIKHIYDQIKAACPELCRD